MDREAFKSLRDVPGKQIRVDITWNSPSDLKPNLVFDRVEVENDLGWRAWVNGTYKPDVPAVSYNFQVVGIGPVCRVEVNGPVHGDAGRTHKHDLHQESDPRNNLPRAQARTDLEQMSPRELWDALCRMANITHTGLFHDPE